MQFVNIDNFEIHSITITQVHDTMLKVAGKDADGTEIFSAVLGNNKEPVSIAITGEILEQAK